MRPSIINQYNSEGHVNNLHYDFGCGVIERTHVRQNYNRTYHQLRLVSGEWPTEIELLRWLGADPYCGGGSIGIDGETATASIGGCE